jgi:hypothetical protein
MLDVAHRRVQPLSEALMRCPLMQLAHLAVHGNVQSGEGEHVIIPRHAVPAPAGVPASPVAPGVRPPVQQLPPTMTATRLREYAGLLSNDCNGWGTKLVFATATLAQPLPPKPVPLQSPPPQPSQVAVPAPKPAQVPSLPVAVAVPALTPQQPQQPQLPTLKAPDSSGLASVRCELMPRPVQNWACSRGHMAASCWKPRDSAGAEQALAGWESGVSASDLFASIPLPRLKGIKKKHAAPTTHQCSACPYKTTSQTNYARHLRIHTKDRPYACPHCEYRSSRTDDLTKHVMRHSPGMKRLVCVQCAYATYDSSNMSRHCRKLGHFSRVRQPDEELAPAPQLKRARLVSPVVCSPESQAVPVLSAAGVTVEAVSHGEKDKLDDEAEDENLYMAHVSV